MEVRLYPNAYRPGVGQRPRREGHRPMLPQHARHCPVLEAGSALGFLVYPALEPNESFHIEYQGEGHYQFSFLMAKKAGGEWMPIFKVAISLPAGGTGKIKEEVSLASRDVPLTKEAAQALMRAFIVPEDLGTPQGALALRGATNFRTPAGWDTVYAPVFNQIERPIAPSLVVRVETDWYVHGTEFRYVVDPGEGISGTHYLPLGQVFFVPREDVTFQDCTDEEVAALQKTQDEFFHEKAASKIATSTGLQYSPLYAHQSGSRKKRPGASS